MDISSLALIGLTSIALTVTPSAASGDGDGDLPEIPGDVCITSPYYTVDNDSIFQAVGDGMINAASAALPVGIGVMAVTGGIPVAKKVIKQLSS